MRRRCSSCPSVRCFTPGASARASRTPPRDARTSVNWSKLAQAGESSTTSPASRLARRGRDGRGEVAGALERHARGLERRRDLLRRLADQVGAVAGRERRARAARTAPPCRGRRGSRACARRGTTRARAARRRRSSPWSRSRSARRRPSPTCSIRCSTPGKRAQRLGDRRVGDPGGAGRGGRRGGVLAVVRARDARARRAAGRRRANSTRRAAPGTGAEAARHHRDVVRPLVLEDPQLRVAVGLEAAVAVEVVGLEVEQHGDARTERLDVLELERRELADDPGGRVAGADEADERSADVAGDLGLDARRARTWRRAARSSSSSRSCR